MVSRRVIFWDVDTQVDFMQPEGKLYVPGAEKLLPNLNLLTDAARRNEVFLVSDACVHGPDDEEFKRFPPHCLRGTPGAAIVPETIASTSAYETARSAMARSNESFEAVRSPDRAWSKASVAPHIFA